MAPVCATAKLGDPAGGCAGSGAALDGAAAGSAAADAIGDAEEAVELLDGPSPAEEAASRLYELPPGTGKAQPEPNEHLMST